MKQGRTICLVALGAALLAGCFGKKNTAPAAGTSAEPDKVLYAKATNDLKHGRYSVGRLALQTLINTYPDSEYLAKAKLAIGDSYYKEGGTAGLKQSIVEYKDFITFFPFLDESANAQMQIAMAHYRQMEKPDRDHAEAVQAEAEFQTFLEKYPNSPLASPGRAAPARRPGSSGGRQFQSGQLLLHPHCLQGRGSSPDRIDKSLSPLQPGGSSQLDARADL